MKLFLVFLTILILILVSYLNIDNFIKFYSPKFKQTTEAAPSFFELLVKDKSKNGMVVDHADDKEESGIFAQIGKFLQFW